MISRFSRPFLMIVLLGSSLLTPLKAAVPALFPLEDRFAGNHPNTNAWLIDQDQSSTNDRLLQDKGLHFIVPTIGSTNSDTWIWKNNLPTNSDWSITLNVENLATSPFTNSFAGIGLTVGNTNGNSNFGMALSYDPAEGGVLWEASLDAGSNSMITTTNSSVKKGALLLSYSAESGAVTAAYCLHPQGQSPNWVSLASASLDQLSLTNTNDTFEIAITASSFGIKLGKVNGLSVHDFAVTNSATGMNNPNPSIQFVNLHKIGALTYTTNPVRINLPTASSGLPVNVSIQSGPATLDGDRVHILGTGTVTLLATQAGNDRYSAATNSDFFTIVPAQQRIDFPTIPKLVIPYKYGQLFGWGAKLKARSSSQLPITYTVVSGPGLLVVWQASSYYFTNSAPINFVTLGTPDDTPAPNSGTVTIRADQSGNPNYYSAPPVTRSFSYIYLQPPAASGGGGSGSIWYSISTSTGFPFSQ